MEGNLITRSNTIDKKRILIAEVSSHSQGDSCPFRVLSEYDKSTIHLNL